MEEQNRVKQDERGYPVIVNDKEQGIYATETEAKENLIKSIQEHRDSDSLNEG